MMGFGHELREKWDKVAYESSQDYWQWHSLQAMNEAFCVFLSYKNVSIETCPHIIHIILLEELQSTECFWEDLSEEELGTHKGYTKLQVMMHIVHSHRYGAAYKSIIYQCLISVGMRTVEYILLLYASWHCFFQVVAVSHAKLVVKLMDSVLMAGKATIERNKELTTQDVGASSCTTLLFPRYDPVLPLYVNLTTQISLMAFVKAHQ